MKKIKILLLVLITLSFLNNISIGVTSKDVFNRLRLHYKDADGFRASFKRTYCEKETGICRIMKGKLLVKKPNKMRMEVSSPQKQVTISDGNFLYIHQIDKKQVLRSKIQDGEKVANIVQVLFASLKQDEYEIKSEDDEEIDGKMFSVIKLIPHSENPFFVSLKIWIDPSKYNAYQVEFEERNGDTVGFNFSKQKLEKRIEDKEFEFVIPEGVEVIENP